VIILTLQSQDAGWITDFQLMPFGWTLEGYECSPSLKLELTSSEHLNWREHVFWTL